ncbi:hypothetical protein [Crocosphaera sp. Alani8]|uniref:hypothetical protein n=1 Tax=Crocosphaera sp. Alani8 TaxID=3038952 RepID=UPI00313B10EA
MKSLHLFVKKPPIYNEQWSIVHGYGINLLENSFKNFCLLESKQENSNLFTACAGKLSLRPPKTGTFDSFLGNNNISLSPDSLSISRATLNLYLHLSPFVALNPSFRRKNQGLGNIIGFAYFDVEVLSLKEFLPQYISGSILKNLLEEAGIEIDLSEELSEDAKIAVLIRFLRGRLEPLVETGSLLAKVSQNKQIGFAVLTDFGTIDPASIYDEMRDFVEDGQQDVDSFIQFMDSRPEDWPINLDLFLLKQNLYPMTVLEDIRRERNLTPQQWREDVGNNQKKLWLDRLLKRSGHAPATSTAPPFEFNDLDWQNIFQLEAIVEFYANFDDPWKEGAVPILPGDPKYKTVDFLDLNGTQATVEGKKVTLDGSPDLSRVKETKKKGFLYDTIFFEKDRKRTNKLYRIEEVDVANNTITLDDSPDLTEDSSVWRINLRPILVIIDPIGSRIQGQKAKISDPSKPKIIKLEDLPTKLKKREKINRFDTIYLPSDRNTDSKPNRTYRILKIDEAEKTVTLDGNPNLDGSQSAWYIPAGINGELSNLNYNLGPDKPDKGKGFDQYEALLFIIHNGKVYKKLRWSSFTSRNAAKKEYLSSIKGNELYDFASVTATRSNFQNYCFRVVDRNANYDGVRKARFYFEPIVTPDEAAPNQNPVDGGKGKTGIRLHDGNRGASGSGSNGCLVSPSFYELRDQLIFLYGEDYGKFKLITEKDIEKQLKIWIAYGKERKTSRAYFKKYLSLKKQARDEFDKKAKEIDKDDSLTNEEKKAKKDKIKKQIDKKLLSNILTPSDWNNKLVGTVWLIRPDERPLG